MRKNQLVDRPSSSFDQTNQAILGDPINIAGDFTPHYHLAESPPTGVPYPPAE